MGFNKWHRSDGRQLPGLQDASSIEKVNLPAPDGRYLIVNGKYEHWPNGITVSSIKHRGRYRVTFPEAVFEEEGVREKMLPSTFEFVGALAVGDEWPTLRISVRALSAQHIQP